MYPFTHATHYKTYHRYLTKSASIGFPPYCLNIDLDITVASFLSRSAGNSFGILTIHFYNMALYRVNDRKGLEIAVIISLMTFFDDEDPDKKKAEVFRVGEGSRGNTEEKKKKRDKLRFLGKRSGRVGDERKTKNKPLSPSRTGKAPGISLFPLEASTEADPAPATAHFFYNPFARPTLQPPPVKSTDDAPPPTPPRPSVTRATGPPLPPRERVGPAQQEQRESHGVV